MRSLPCLPLHGGLSTSPLLQIKKIAALLSMALCSACAVGPDFERPAPPQVSSYTKDTQGQGSSPVRTLAADALAQTFSADTSLPADWWRLFGSPELNQLVDFALQNNPGLQASEASLRQSQDSVRAAYGVYFPQVDLNGQGRRQRTAPVQEGSAGASTIFNFVSVGGSISYVLDVFGGERRMIEGLRATAESQHYQNRAAYLMLSANVVNTSMARAAYAEQIMLTEALIQADSEQLRLLQTQLQAGTLNYASVLSLQSQLAAYQAALAPLRQKRDQAEHLLASLIGKTPAEAGLPQIAVHELHLPTDLPLSLPSELVRQRPDILAAEAQMHAASANVGVATAALFPSISLNGSFGIAGSNWGNMSSAGQRFWSVGPGIDLPLLKGNNGWYERKAALDAYQAAQANYRQTVLAAFAQVADALNALQHDAENLQARVDARQAAAETLRLIRINYQSGIAAYTDVLLADVQLHQAGIDYLQALVQRQQDTVALFVALGGGWWNTPSAGTQEAAQ
jgi:NodT family efflux transporter outer membrane factor (OMF) lipoprotein